MAKIHFLNVDEGDCSIIEHDNGKITMIDICCGNIEGGENMSETFSKSSANNIKGNYNQKAYPTNPVEYLKEHGVKTIFRYIQTHPDMDHMDGLENLSNTFSILNFWDTENNKKQDFDINGKSGKFLKKDWDCYMKLRSSTSFPKALFYYDGSTNKYYAEDDNGKLKDDYIKILAPTKDLLKAAEKVQDWNDSSYVILYCVQGRKILFCGDADMGTITHLIRNHKDDVSNLDVLIAPHHGRNSDKDFMFLDIMKPKLTLIGNAKCKHLAYDEWNSRGLYHIQNNQGGNILIEIYDGKVYVSCSNERFASDYVKENFKMKGAVKNRNNPGYWSLFYY